MLRGGFQPRGLLEDVLLIALIDTGVPVWALDADTLDGPLGIRTSREGEPLGRAPDAQALPAGRLVVADASAALGVLFGRPRPGTSRARARAGECSRSRSRACPTLFAEEALWTCRQRLRSPERVPLLAAVWW